MKRIAVVIPTRGRGAQAAEAARAVLADPIDMELVVVDQSPDDSTASAFAELLKSDSRVRLLRSATRGASNARNAGVAATTAPIIAFTDDDCRPHPGWASAMLRVLEGEEPAADLVFGRVYLPPKENPDDYAASFEPQARLQRGQVPLPNGDLGIGANFAIRRAALAALGGFDPLLGPGAPYFRGAEETDLLIRAIHDGRLVVNAKECEVLHLGVRTGADVRPLHVAYQFAVGGAFGKHARLGGFSAARDAAGWAAFYVKWLAREIAAGHRPRPGVLYYFVSGALLTFRYGLDRRRHVFVDRSARP